MTTDLKTMLFERTYRTLGDYMDMVTGVGPSADYPIEDRVYETLDELKRREFCTLYDLILDAGLEDEYLNWKIDRMTGELRRGLKREGVGVR